MATLQLPLTHGNARIAFDDWFVPMAFQTVPDESLDIIYSADDRAYIVDTAPAASSVSAIGEGASHQIVINPSDHDIVYDCWYWNDGGVGYVWIQER